jgi:plasmid stabilization system protein ParE
VTLRIIITPNAEAELRAAYRYIHDRAPEAAREWVKGARRKIKSLARDPERAPLAPESVSFENPIRELFYGSGNRGTYRILFTVLGQQVYVLHFRHGSMLPVEPDQ